MGVNLVDSCGWLEVLGDGPNAEFFEPVLMDKENLLVPTLCIYEVLRRLVQWVGESDAKEMIGALYAGIVVPVSDEIAVAAALLGGELRLSLADSIILATAQSAGAVLWTQDAHFKDIAGVRYQQKLSSQPL